MRHGENGAQIYYYAWRRILGSFTPRRPSRGAAFRREFSVASIITDAEREILSWNMKKAKINDGLRVEAILVVRKTPPFVFLSGGLGF
jgi:hypothetical protein